MKSTNLNVEHNLILVKREKEIVITTLDGVEIANLTVQTMTKGVPVNEEGSPTKWKDVPTKNFFLVFTSATKPDIDKNIASVLTEEQI
jgi:hypothetical protein